MQKVSDIRRSEAGLRFMLFIPYWIVIFTAIFAFYRTDSFCHSPGSHSYILEVAGLTLTLALWDFLVGALSGAALHRLDPNFEWFWARVIISTVLVGAGLAYLPFWIYTGAGEFRFAGTWADVSCFFTEGYLVSFLFFLVPSLALATFFREIALILFASRYAGGKVRL
jgi:hypothetical protein